MHMRELIPDLMYLRWVVQKHGYTKFTAQTKKLSYGINTVRARVVGREATVMKTGTAENHDAAAEYDG